MATKELNAKQDGPSGDRDVPRYTEAEYARVALAADTAEHERDGLAELNDRQAREIKRLKTAVESANKLFKNCSEDRDRWKRLRYDALDDINYWREEAAKRIIGRVVLHLLTLSTKGVDVKDALTVIEDAQRRVKQARFV